MKKQIAVMMCAISLDNQRKILEGILDGAKELDCDVFVFTNHVSHTEKEINKQGAFKIMELPDFELFDGVIVAGNTIQYEPCVERLVETLKKSDVPVVSIDEKIAGMGYVGISNYSAQKQIVEHIIHTHHVAKVAYITGRLTNLSGMQRYHAYMDAMREAGIEGDGQLIFKGNYDVASGRLAVDYFLRQEDNFPEAIVCANDNMALGAIDQLRLHGYRVPEDVLVTGFDGDDMANYCRPSVTTVNGAQRSCGCEAVKMLFGQGWKDEVHVETSLCLGGSCGCNVVRMQTEDLGENYAQTMQIIHQATDSIKNMTTEFAGLENEKDLMEVLKKYVMHSDMEAFYLCRCMNDDTDLLQTEPDGRMDIHRVHTEYTTHMHVALAYEKGRFEVCNDIERREIVPKMARGRAGCRLFIAVPIFYQNYCYGYCVSVNSLFPLKSELFFSWVLNVGIGLENIRKWNMLNETVGRLNEMWAYDMLTHVYNRAGFYHYADTYLRKMRRDQNLAMLLFIDIDGLKIINDSMGHHAGDECIRQIANCIRENLRDGQIVMRYGGDEFVVFGSCESEDDAGIQVKKIKDTIEERNRKGINSFELGTSIGMAIYRADDIRDLNEIIERADEQMYEEKRRKKALKLREQW